MERRLSAILAADVVGYSRLMERDEAGTFERLRTFRTDLFEPKISQHRGRIFKLTGDGLFAEFASVVNAVECAVSLQRELVERNQDVGPEDRIELRIGINLGDVIVENEDRHGEGVNIAARLEALADPGGICVSRTVVDHVKNKLALSFESLGQQQVKNISEPVWVYRVSGVSLGRRLPRQAAKRKLYRYATYAALLLLLIIGAGAGWLLRDQRSSTALALPDKPSIAVLPFRSLSDDPQWQRFADGMTEDITTDLGHSRDLFVIARSSTEAYKSKEIDARQVGWDLGVKYLLQGSIQPLGDQVRVSVQLIDAGNGSQVWTKRYDRPASDLFAIQEEVIEQLTGTLTGYEGTIAQTERTTIRRKEPKSLTAYDHYLLGMEAQHKLTAEEIFKSEELFKKAIELDPQLARAYVGLVHTYGIIIDFGLSSDYQGMLEKHWTAAQQAVQFDPNDGEAHLVSGIAYLYYKRDCKPGVQEFNRAEELASNNADLLILIAFYLPGCDDPARALQLAERAIRLNPNYPNWYNNMLREIYFYNDKFYEALVAANKVDSKFAYDHAIRAMIQASLGRKDEAEKSASEAKKLDTDWSVERWNSDIGGLSRTQVTRLIKAANEAGLPVCVPETSAKESPHLIRLDVCEQERGKRAAG
jgi:class 3 adenylate cyclase/TolB-like protein